MQHTERRVVFFDLDGTLHQQDMFGSFLRYLPAPFAAEPVAGGGDGAGDPCRTGGERTGGALADEPPAVGDNLWPPRGGC